MSQVVYPPRLPFLLLRKDYHRVHGGGDNGSETTNCSKPVVSSGIAADAAGVSNVIIPTITEGNNECNKSHSSPSPSPSSEIIGKVVREGGGGKIDDKTDKEENELKKNLPLSMMMPYDEFEDVMDDCVDSLDLIAKMLLKSWDRRWRQMQQEKAKRGNASIDHPDENNQSSKRKLLLC